MFTLEFYYFLYCLNFLHTSMGYFLFLYYLQSSSGIREWDHGPFFVFVFVLLYVGEKKTLINVILSKAVQGPGSERGHFSLCK